MKNKLLIILFLFLLPDPIFAATLYTAPIHESTHRLSNEPSQAEVLDAIRSWKLLSGKEKREKMRTVRHAMRAYIAPATSAHPRAIKEPLLIIIAILLPPLAIYLLEGEIRKCFWISIVLTLLFWIPGVLYAIVIINKDWKKYHPQ